MALTLVMQLFALFHFAQPNRNVHSLTFSFSNASYKRANASPYSMHQTSHHGIGTSNTIMGLLTWNSPSCQTKEPDTIAESIAPSILSTKLRF